MSLLAHCFHDETDKSIRKSIGKKDPIETNAEMETKTGEHDWLSEKGEIPHDSIFLNRTWKCGVGIQRPSDRNQKAHTRPCTNSEFHATRP